MFNSAKAVLKAVSFMTTTDDGERRKEEYRERDEEMIESGCERGC